MSDQNVEVKFGATIEELKKGLSDAIGQFKSFSTSAQDELANKAAGAFGSFGQKAKETFDLVQKSADQIPAAMRNVGLGIAGAFAVIGAGVAAKKFADDNVKMVEATEDFARALGTTTNEASIIAAALEDVGASQGEYTAAARGLSRELRTNEDGLKRLGLATRDANGNLRPMNDLMLDAIRIVNTHKAGTDRSIASQQMFGRAVEGSSRLLLHNKQTTEETRKAMEELHLIVGAAAKAAKDDYDAAADRAALSTKGFGRAIQESVLPVATELTQWFNAIAPKAIEATRVALGGLSTAFVSLTLGVRIAWETINAMVVSVAEPLVAFGRAVTAILSGQGMEAAGAELAKIPRTVQHAWNDAFDSIFSKTEETSKRIAGVWAWATGGNKAPGSSGPEGTNTANTTKPGTGEDKLASARLALERARLEAERAVQLEHIKVAQSIDDDAYKIGLLSAQEYFDRKLVLERKAFDVSLATLREELAEVEKAEAAARAKSLDMKLPAQERAKWEVETVRLQAQQQPLLAKIAVLESQRADAVRSIGVAYDEVTRKIDSQLAAIALGSAKQGTDAGIAAERAKLEQLRALRQISAEEAFALQRDIEQRAYAATVADLAARRALVEGSEADVRVQRAQLDAEAQQAEREHQQRLTEIDNAAIRERKQANIDAQRSIQGAFASMIRSLMDGTKTMGEAIRSFAVQVGQVFTDLIAQRFAERLFEKTGVNRAIDAMVDAVLGGIEKMVVAWAAKEETETAATAAGAATRTAIETTASATSKTLTIGDAIMSIGARAAQAAAGVYAALAAIPVVGPFLAPAAAIAAFATVGSFAKRIFSAERGWGDVSFDGAPTLLHKNEMVLPASLAQGVRQMAEPGQLQASILQAVQQMQPRAGGDRYEFTIHALDGADVKRVLMNNGGALVAAMKKHHRDFRFV